MNTGQAKKLTESDLNGLMETLEFFARQRLMLTGTAGRPRRKEAQLTKPANRGALSVI
jgi:hypothetical protein